MEEKHFKYVENTVKYAVILGLWSLFALAGLGIAVLSRWAF